jgi:hypothetical protein
VTVSAAHLDHARRVADAVLYEGYLLYPYRKSAQKNRSRFQFGVLMPPAYAAVDPHEPSASQTECLLECRDDATVWVVARFLQLRARTVQAADPASGELRHADSLLACGAEYGPYDEAAEREHRVSVPVASLLRGDAEFGVRVADGQESDDVTASDGSLAGRLIYRWGVLDAVIRVHAERLPGPYGVLLLRVRVENRTVPAAQPHVRHDGLRHALISAHALIGVEDGSFLSMTDPPEWASQLVAGCTNTGTWPVLAGPADCRNLMLASPIILYDHPEIAAESAGDLFDATEIDEILTLRTLAMTDAEKAEARATDPRAAGLLDRLDGLPPQMLEKMHGAIRYLGPAGGPASRTPAEPPEYRTPPGTVARTPAEPAELPGYRTPPGTVARTPAEPAELPGYRTPPGTVARTPAEPAELPGYRTPPGTVARTPAEPAEPLGYRTPPGTVARTPAEPAELPGYRTPPEPGEVRVEQPSVPWWDPGSDSSVSPETDHVMIQGVWVARGSKVVMRPGSRRADAQDLFLSGREATVEAVLFDVDGQVHVAVSPDGDPLADVQRVHGRFLYFAPDELEPAGAGSGAHHQSSGRDRGSGQKEEVK